LARAAEEPSTPPTTGEAAPTTGGPTPAASDPTAAPEADAGPSALWIGVGAGGAIVALGVAGLLVARRSSRMSAAAEDAE
jgi:hypothetical protein